MAIIYGSLFTLCGLCGVVSLAAQGATGQNIFVGNDPVQAQIQKQVQDALKRDVPGYEASQVISGILTLVLSAAILIAGIGILSLRRWSRALGLVACVITIAVTAIQALYQAVYVIPVMSEAFRVILPLAAPQAGPQGAQALKFMETMMTLVAVFTVGLYVILAVYLGIIVILLLRSPVRAAFEAAEGAGWEDRFHDESRRTHDDEEDDDWDRPGRY
jgi:hypothetical protein